MTKQIERALSEIKACVEDEEDGSGYLMDYMRGGGGLEVVTQALQASLLAENTVINSADRGDKKLAFEDFARSLGLHLDKTERDDGTEFYDMVFTATGYKIWNKALQQKEPEVDMSEMRSQICEAVDRTYGSYEHDIVSDAMHMVSSFLELNGIIIKQTKP